MALDCSSEFKLSAQYEVEQPAPELNTVEPEVTVVHNPALINDVQSGGDLLAQCKQPLEYTEPSGGILGDFADCMKNLAADVCDAGNKIIQAELRQEGQIVTAPVNDTAYVAPENTVHLNRSAAEMSGPSAPSAFT